MGTGLRARAWRRAAPAAIAMLIVAGGWSPVLASPGQPAPKGVRAFLDGKPLKLEAVADWFCDDFSYPDITCFSQEAQQQDRSAAIEAATGVTYVTIYDFPNFAGSYMQVSQDYTILAFLGWSDRISSFKARNGLEGHFYTDWFYGGTGYYFCCNDWAWTLGSYDNTFSSVIQN
jgi:hypothetical protein